MIKLIRNSIAILILTLPFSIAYGQSCRDLFTRTSIEESLASLDFPVPLSILDHFYTIGSEVLRFVGQSFLSESSLPRQKTFEVTLENIMTGRTAHRTSLEIRDRNANESIYLLLGQTSQPVSLPIQLKSKENNLPDPSKLGLKETYRFKSEKIGAIIVVTLIFETRNPKETLVRMPTISGSRLYRKPKESGQEPNWKLLGGSFQIEKPVEK